jgi:ribonuclease R
MQFNKKGDLVDYRITKSVIRSSKRFTYKEAKLVLDGVNPSPHAKTLKLMVELCHVLKKKRFERGSIEFSMPELVIVVDPKGVPTGTDYIAYDITHQMVEEFMLKANEVVALHLSNEGKNVTYRVHEEPAEEHLKEFSILAAAFGYKISEKPTPAELQEMFAEALQTSLGTSLATHYIRRMRLAMYSPENIGHYGLALTHYCHFTSPIRRYVDLVAHRLLFGMSDEIELLEEISRRCSERERISSRAESSVVLLKKLRLVSSLQKEDPRRQYEAVITKVKPFGLFFEVVEYMLEGFIHISEVGHDYYHFDELKMAFEGERTGARYTVGDKITVMLKEIDLILSLSRWSMVNSSPRMHKKKNIRRK